MLVDVSILMLDGDSPLLVPPVRLREHAAIDHGEPVVAPEIDVDFRPVTVVLNLFRIEHQRTVDTSAGDVGLQAGFLDDGAIALGEFFAEIADVNVVLARENFAERRETSSHRHAVRVERAAVEDLVLRDQIHYRAARAERSQWQAAADGLSQTDHVRLHPEEFAGAAPGQLGAGLDFVEDQQRAILVANIAQSLKEAGLRETETDVHKDGLEDDRGNLSRMLLKTIFDALQIVEAGDNNILERSLRHAPAPRYGIGRVRIAVVFRFGLNTDERRVMQTVVGAFEFQNVVVPRCGTRNAASMHRDFRA